MADDTPDLQAGDNQDTRPDWLPSNFDTPEALAKSYGEAQRKISELGEKAKQAEALEENYNQLAQHVQALEAQQLQAQQHQQEDPLIAAYVEAGEVGDFRRQLAIGDQINQMRIQQAIAQARPNLQPVEDRQTAFATDYAWNNLVGKYGEDLINRRDEIAQTLEEYNLLHESQAGDVRATEKALEAAYKLANPLAFVDQSQLANPTAASTAMKEQAQTATGAGVRVLTPDEAAAEWDKIKNAKPQTYY